MGGVQLPPLPKPIQHQRKGSGKGCFPTGDCRLGQAAACPFSRRGKKPSTKLTYRVCAPGRDKKPFQGAEAGEKQGPHIFPAMRIARFSFSHVKI